MDKYKFCFSCLSQLQGFLWMALSIKPPEVISALLDWCVPQPVSIPVPLLRTFVGGFSSSNVLIIVGVFI